MKTVKFLQKNIVLLICMGIFLVFSLIIILFTLPFYEILESVSVMIRQGFGRYYLYLGLGCVTVLLVLALLPTGRLSLGKTGEGPEFSTFSWIAMLYSAGMGAGILLRAVQEPVYMYMNPPVETGQPVKTIALEYTFYQWGLTAWAFYALFALITGYAMMKWNKKPLLSSTLEGQGPSRPWLKGLDILVILTTVVGITGAICLGTTQITGGLNHLLEGSYGIKLNIGFVLLICCLAFISAWKGLNKGIKVVSNLNIALTTLLLIYVLFSGNSLSIFREFFTALYYYITDFVPLSLASGNFDPGEAFLQNWTYYYWAFWIAWAPFTGIFIARISRGRSIRSFVLGVLIIPSMASFIWFTGFGNTAIDLIGHPENYNGQFTDEFSSIFEFFSLLPYSGVVNGIIIFLLVGFLVTSVDSGIYVLSMFTDQGKLHPKKKHRLIWAVLLAIGGCALLILSGIKQDIDIINILQLLLIVTSLPFALILPVVTAIFIRKLINFRS